MKKLLLILGTVIVLMVAIPSTASASTWCNYGGPNLLYWRWINAYPGGWQLCIESSGTGYERAWWYMGNPYHTGQIPGRYLVHMTDNGYGMANSWEVLNPYFPFSFWTNWVYHPYWGEYCAQGLARDQYGWFLSINPKCVWINGYQ